ncbi:hypothetical protein BgiMline_015201 [Biomphalaria glabrata]|nr:hypothetical protein BgiMline_022312 [Biomphalaria glabrata]
MSQLQFTLRVVRKDQLVIPHPNLVLKLTATKKTGSLQKAATEKRRLKTAATKPRQVLKKPAGLQNVIPEGDRLRKL